MIRVVALLLLCAALLSTTSAPACGPFFETAVFEPEEVPPAIGEFNKGRIGIVRGSYRVFNLITAWRVLSGKSAIPSPYPVESTRRAPSDSPMDAWSKARLEVVKTERPTPLTPDRKAPGSDFQTYLNCPDPALDKAAATLRARIRQFGANHDGVRKWVKAQDAVFSNCGEGSSRVDPPEPGLAPVLAADRRYQSAAALFYAGEFGKARSAWLAVAEDSASPWRPWGKFLAARCLVREATLGKPELQKERLEKAEIELRAAAAETTEAEVRRSATGVRDWVESKLHPLMMMARYARTLEGNEWTETDELNLIHIWSVVDDAVLQPGTGSELLDWLFAMRGKMPPEEIVARWRKNQSDTWLVAALQALKHEDPFAAELLEASAQVAPTSPAFPTAVWARVRLSSTETEKRMLLDATLSELRRQQPAGALNFFLRERLAVAQNFDEFITFAPREAGAQASVGMPGPVQDDRTGQLLDEDGAAVLNRFLPVARWTQVIESGKWSAHLTERLARAAFVRSLATGDEPTAARLATRVKATAPDAVALLTAWESARDAEARRFAAAWAILKLPGLQPEVRAGFDREEKASELNQFRDNWWCAAAVTTEQNGQKPQEPPAWITAEERKRAAEEWNAAGGTMAFVTPIVMDWAEKHTADPRAAEALALVVRVSRYGCRDASTGKFSKQAFTLLHRKYPASNWAKQTPCWFGAP